MKPIWDAIIVGGGPAGASCAVWLARLGFAPLLLEAGPRLGGLTAENPFRDDWIAALPEVTGRQVAANIARSVELACVNVRLDARVAAVRRTARGFEVECEPGRGQGGETAGGPGMPAAPAAGGAAAGEAAADGGPARHAGRTLVLATGVKPRPLDPARPHERWPGVLVGPGAHVAAADYAGRSVAILGGGDNAFENYAYVRRRGAASAHIYARSVRAQRQWVRAVDPADLRVGPYRADPQTRAVDGRAYDLMLVFYGWEPQAACAAGLDLRRDARGFIATDPATAMASVPGCYAIGEVAQRMHPCVATALADGVVAAKAIERALQG